MPNSYNNTDYLLTKTDELTCLKPDAQSCGLSLQQVHNGEHLYSAFVHIRAQSALTLIITLKTQESNTHLILSQLSRKLPVRLQRLSF